MIIPYAEEPAPARDPLKELKDELKSVEKEINQTQWKGRGVPGQLYSRRTSLRQRIMRMEGKK